MLRRKWMTESTEDMDVEQLMHQLLEHVFSGQYSYKRSISSPQISLEGTACFEQSDTNRLLYHEQGYYRLGESEQSCYQKQIFIYDASNLYIYKNDLSLLHEFTLDTMLEFPVKLTHTHLCKNDRYALEMVIHSFNTFSMSYKVQGPSKQYKIHTIFNRKSMLKRG